MSRPFRFNREYPSEHTLIGDFVCRLTNTEVNEWSLYIKAQPIYVDYHLAFLLRDKHPAEDSVREWLRLSRLLYSLAEGWYKRIEERRKKVRELEEDLKEE